MNRPKKILAVYDELSQHVEVDISEKELLRSSDLIVKSYKRKMDSYKSISEGPLPRENWPLDRVFREVDALVYCEEDWHRAPH